MKAGTTIVLLLSILHACLPVNAQTASGVVNTYYHVSAINTTANSVTVDNASGLTPGQRVLLSQAKGTVIDNSNTSAFGDITALNNAGNYEFNTICTINGNEVGLKFTLLNSYDPAGQVQLVGIPSYGSVTVTSTVSSIPWDPVTGKGGIVVIEAAGALFLNADIDVRGQGFRGGDLLNYFVPPYDCSWAFPVDAYALNLPASGYYTGGKKGEGITDYILNKEYGRGKLANGGGGGNNTNSGGAGGGNVGAGGVGGRKAGETTFFCHGIYPGIGGLSLAPYGYSTAANSNRIFFGGGGGSGHQNNSKGMPGGNGGGIILLSASSITGGGGQLLASGVSPIVLGMGYADPTQAEGDGGGGGGAGGTVILNTATITGAVTVQANGAKGSDAGNMRPECTGPGGGGGGGMIWTAGGAVPAAISASVSGGANGIVSLGNTLLSCQGSSNGALPGDAGSSQAGYTAPESTMNTCVLLASSPLKYFTGTPEEQGFRLSWGLISPEEAGKIQSFTVERSVDQIHFTPLAIIPGPADPANNRYTDIDKIPGTVFYRLEWLDKEGSRSYSRILTHTRPSDPGIEWIRLQPNPASDQLSVNLFSPGPETATLQLFTAQGQLIASYPLSLHSGITSRMLPVKDLPAATYFLVVDTKGRRQVKSFIKR